jgi:hypothetical protein
MGLHHSEPTMKGPMLGPLFENMTISAWVKATWMQPGDVMEVVSDCPGFEYLSAGMVSTVRKVMAGDKGGRRAQDDYLD